MVVQHHTMPHDFAPVSTLKQVHDGLRKSEWNNGQVLKAIFVCGTRVAWRTLLVSQGRYPLQVQKSRKRHLGREPPVHYPNIFSLVRNKDVPH
jgi:cell wall assembly regulator SMI1